MAYPRLRREGSRNRKEAIPYRDCIETVHVGRWDAQKRARQLQTKVESDGFVKPARMTLRQYLHRWLENSAEPEVRPRTFARYKEIVVRHLIPNLGNLQLKELQATHIEGYMVKARKQGRIEGHIDGSGGLSAQTVQHHYRVLSAALTHAADTEYLGRNVARKVKPPTPIKNEVEPLTREEVGKLLHAAFNTDFIIPF